MEAKSEDKEGELPLVLTEEKASDAKESSAAEQASEDKHAGASAEAKELGEAAEQDDAGNCRPHYSRPAGTPWR